MTSEFNQLVAHLDSELGSRQRAAKAADAFSAESAARRRKTSAMIKAAGVELDAMLQAQQRIVRTRRHETIMQVPVIMAKAQAAYQRGAITAHELVVIEATKNRVCAGMASRGLIR